MKSTTVFLFFVMVFSISFSNSMNYYVQHEDSFLDACCVSLDLSQPRSIHNFLSDVFSDRRYATDYLPYNLCTHLMPFLEHGKGSDRKAAYIESSIRLFYNKLKASPFVCNKAFSKMLDCVPQVVKNYCGTCVEDSFLSSVENNMMNIFVPTFLSQFSLFKSKPEEFLKKLARDITTMVETSFNVHDHLAREQLKQMFIRYLELGLMKLIWNPAEQMEIWDSVKNISVQLSDIMEMGLITPDELDDLYKSLIESFCRFLDLTGSEFSRSFVENIREDVCSDALLLFELEEQEVYIETKKDRMLTALMEVEAKIEARMCGIITDVILR